MGTVTLKDAVRMCRTSASFVRACCHWLRSHCIILGLICVLLIVFRVFPCVLRFFISTSPIVICTAVFLNALLTFGPSDGTKEEEKKICEASEENGTRKSEVVFEKSGTDEEKPRDFPEYDSLPISKKSNDDMEDVECSSSENVPINILPVIDETDPLLDPKVPRLPLTSAEELLDSALESSDKSIDESGDSEVENQAKANGDNGAKSLVNWTEDDQKNLMDLGSSELERNQRLESLIARRRARKNFLRLSEKSLMDFRSNDTLFQVPSIATMKNPFDVPYSFSEFDGLTTPGSAPSVMVPRKNPFDLPYDPQEEKPNLTQDSFHQEYMQIFCRHESFSLGSAGNRQDRYNHRFSPLFGDEDMESSAEVEFSSSNAQSGERRHESDALPPIDPKNRKKKMGRVMSLGVYPSNDRRVRKFADVPLIRPNQEVKREATLNRERNDSNDSGLHDRTGALTESEIVKEKHDELSPSSSSEINEEVIDVKKEELESNGSESPAADDVKVQYNDTKEEALEETDLNNRVMEEVKDACIKEAAYNSSDSSSSIASDMHVEVSEAGSPGGESFDRFLYTESLLTRSRLDKKLLESRYNVVLDKEAKPIDGAAVREHNAVKTGAPARVSASENLGAVPVEPKLAAEQSADSSNSVLHQVKDSKDKDQTNDTLHSDEESSEVQVEADTVTIDSKAPSMSPSSDLDKGETLREDTSVQPSSHRDDHHEVSQEKSLNAAGYTGKIDIVKEPVPVSNDDKEKKRPISIEHTTEGGDNIPKQDALVNLPKSVEATDVGETNGGHEIPSSKPLESNITHVDRENAHETNNTDVARNEDFKQPHEVPNRDEKMS